MNIGVTEEFCKLAEMEIAAWPYSSIAMPVQHYSLKLLRS